jgi:pilus assembly protein Flp/PilA
MGVSDILAGSNRIHFWRHLMLKLRERGQGLAEYALILALIAILAIGALTVLSGAVNGILSRVGSVL